jgi:hypothetical protein
LTSLSSNRENPDVLETQRRFRVNQNPSDSFVAFPKVIIPMSVAKLFAFAIVLSPMIWNSVLADEPRVQEIPLPKEARDTTYVRSRGDIRFKITSNMKAAGNFYATTLNEQQWTKLKKDNLQKNFWIQSFAKKELSLEVRVDQREGDCEIRLTPKGFIWDEDLAPRPKDLPIPEDVKELKYDDFFERIEFQSATPLDRLADFYVSKLDTKTWSRTGTDLVTAGTVQLRRTSGKASVLIAVSREGDLSQVKITTKGMVWDEIKAANALAKKSREKVADRASSTAPKPKQPVELPKRVEKSLKGIAQLEKLKSRCVITFDGKPMELPQIIAYECVSQGRWRTKIVATESAIKQQQLLEQLKITASDEGWEPPRPFLKLDLDDANRVTAISFNTAQLTGGDSGDDLEGEAIVEEGRARGTVKLKPKKFFEKEYSAEITFDVPLLTGDSSPAKRLANAPKLPNTGTLTIAGKSHSLAHITVYESQQFDATVTVVLLTERPINLPKLKASLSKPARNDDGFTEFQPQIKLVFNAREQLQGMSIWCDSLSISTSGGDNIKASVEIEDGRARGTAKTTESGATFGKKYDFNITFDASVIALPEAAK